MNKNRSSSALHLVGGGIGSMAAAAFVIRDGGVLGRNITIYESLPVLGGSLDAGAIRKKATPSAAAACSRLIITNAHGDSSIDSLTGDPNKSVFEETIEFNERMKSHSRARLVDRNRAIVDVRSMGFTMTERRNCSGLRRPARKTSEQAASPTGCRRNS